jgi:hypothetical protein
MRAAFLFLMFGVSFALHGMAQPGSPDQRRPDYENRIELKGSLGYSNFLDDGSRPHFVTGGAARFRLFRGLGFEPELTYMYRSEHDRDILLIPNLIWEFRRHGRVVPYLIGGVGLLHHRETWGAYNRSGNYKIAQAGFGAKFFLGRRLFVAPEIRIGWEPHIRIAGTLGYVLKK